MRTTRPRGSSSRSRKLPQKRTRPIDTTWHYPTVQRNWSINPIIPQSGRQRRTTKIVAVLLIIRNIVYNKKEKKESAMATPESNIDLFMVVQEPGQGLAD